ncbi:hypothetical protein VTL71DRAFT_9742 [Oculimacula yallundae]|uniref:BZIP domain-containing protein n=1 Tax=Oculimacula yallundae TaxID=86028 RepID=A0ABR4BSK0_9HELO
MNFNSLDMEVNPFEMDMAGSNAMESDMAISDQSALSRGVGVNEPFPFSVQGFAFHNPFAQPETIDPALLTAHSMPPDCYTAGSSYQGGMVGFQNATATSFGASQIGFEDPLFQFMDMGGNGDSQAPQASVEANMGGGPAPMAAAPRLAPSPAQPAPAPAPPCSGGRDRANDEDADERPVKKARGGGRPLKRPGEKGKYNGEGRREKAAKAAAKKAALKAARDAAAAKGNTLTPEELLYEYERLKKENEQLKAEVVELRSRGCNSSVSPPDSNSSSDNFSRYLNELMF